MLMGAAGVEGGFADAGLAQALGRVGQAAPVAADGEGKIACQDMNIELVLADVDAGYLYNAVHLRDPFLACGLADRAAVRAFAKRRRGLQASLRCPPKRPPLTSTGSAPSTREGLQPLPRQRPVRRFPLHGATCKDLIWRSDTDSRHRAYSGREILRCAQDDIASQAVTS